MKKRWISLYVENYSGVLVKVAGLFSAKAYNLDSLTVGPTEDPTVSRMTIGVISDDATFEQIKKQLNRCVEVIKVIDFTNIPIHRDELLYIKISSADKSDREEIFRIAQAFGAQVIDCDMEQILIRCVQAGQRNDSLIQLVHDNFKNIEVVRGGSVAIESISML